MFNSKYMYAALTECQKAKEKGEKEFNETIKWCNKLYIDQGKSLLILMDIEEYINSISNKPREIEIKLAEISLKRKEYELKLEQSEIELTSNEPTNKYNLDEDSLLEERITVIETAKAMGESSTFETVLSGEAISTLAKVIQYCDDSATIIKENVPKDDGEIFLVTLGPIGWIISSGILINRNNKKMAEVAEMAEEKTKKMQEITEKLSEIRFKVIEEIKFITSLNDGIVILLDELKRTGKNDYKIFTDEEKDKVVKLVNTAVSLKERIGEKIA